MDGKIYICPTPIGNMGDVTFRIKEILEQVDLIYAEDTRVTVKILNYYNIHKRLIRLDENSMNQKIPQVLEQASQGKLIAYCSDAGMPGVSDPGMKLVCAARQEGIGVEVLPGATAAVTAYVASGFNCQKFLFSGFFPRKNGDRKAMLDFVKGLDCAVIFYESPKRLVSTLKFLSQEIATTSLAVCRELTKLHEEVVVDSCEKVYEIFSSRSSIKGEITLVLDCSINKNEFEFKKDSDIQRLTNILSNYELPVKLSSKIVSDYYDINQNEAYKIVLDSKNK